MHRRLTCPSPILSLAFAVLAWPLAGMGCGSSDPRVQDGSSPTEAAVLDAPACPATCDDDNPCTADSCDTSTFQCIHDGAPLDGTSCEGKPCTTNSVCGAGVCLDGPFKKCVALDGCHLPGFCDIATGECTNPLSGAKPCDDGDPCTVADRCQSGICAGDTIVCKHQAACVQGSCPADNGFPMPLSAWSATNVSWPSHGSPFVQDGAGAIYVGGAFFNHTDLGTGTIDVEGASERTRAQTNVFLAGIDPITTKATWLRTYAGPVAQSQFVRALAINGQGQIGVIGDLGGGSLTVGGTDIEQVRLGDQFVFGANAMDGSGLWGYRLNLQNGDQKGGNRGVLRAIAGDPTGGTFLVCGNAVCGTGTIPDGGVPPSPAKDLSSSLSCAGGTDVVLARIDAGGETMDGGATASTLRAATAWVEQIGGTDDEDCAALTMDGAGNGYVLGTYRFGSRLTLGTLPTLPVIGDVQSQRAFLAKLDGQNQWEWAVSLGVDGQVVEPTTMIAVAGDLVLAGKVSGLSQAGRGSFLGGDLQSSAFVARLSGRTGKLVWLRGLDAGWDGDSALVDIVSLTEAAGDILVAGNYAKAFTLMGMSLPPPSALGAAFVAELEGSTGAVLMARGYGEAAANSGSQAAGVLGRSRALGAETNTSLLMLYFSGQLHLGSAALGVLQSSTTSEWESCLASLAAP